MLFWLFVIMCVAGFGLLFVSIEYDWSDFFSEFLSPFLIIVSIIALAVSFLILPLQHLGTDKRIAEMNSRYESLVYQYENDIYDNDNDLGKRDLMVDIQDWNADLAGYQAIQDDFWIGIYYPNIYDQFEFIELK